MLERAGEGADATIDVRVEDDTILFEIAEHGAASSGDPRVHIGDGVVALGGRVTLESDPNGGRRVSGSLPFSR